MLQKQTVAPHTFSILKELMAISELNNFQLVGGTALSLQLGHRVSVDIDLFSNEPFENDNIISVLKKYFGERLAIFSKRENMLGVFSFIDDIKIDICKHPQKLIRAIIEEDGIRIWSLEDIAAAKVNAVSRRAVKKDFWDMDILLDKFSIYEITEFFQKKYDPMLAIAVSKMLTYYDDAEDSDTPDCLLNKNWEQVKKSIYKKINNHTK